MYSKSVYIVYGKDCIWTSIECFRERKREIVDNMEYFYVCDYEIIAELNVLDSNTNFPFILSTKRKQMIK